MSKIIKVLLEIPGEIAKGLKNGTMVRDAAGVVRIAKGNPGAGQTVTHLREVAVPTQEAASMAFSPMLLHGAMHLAVLAYVKRRFDVLEEQMGQLFGLIHRMNDVLEELKNHARKKVTEPVLLGLRYYDQFVSTNDDQWLHDAHKQFLKGVVKITDTINGFRSDQVLPEYQWVEKLLLMLAVAESGIIRCSPNEDNHPKDLLACVEHLSGLMENAPSFLDDFPLREVLKMESPGKVKRELKANLIQLRDKLASRESLIDGDSLHTLE